MSAPLSIDQLFEWLVDGAPGANGPVELVTRVADTLTANGAPLERMGAFVSTLHPSVAGRSFAWRPGRGTMVIELDHDTFLQPIFEASPIARIAKDGKELHLRIDPSAAGPREYTVLDDLAAEGFTDYFALPMRFLGGQTQALTFATRAPNGFTDEHLAWFRRIGRPITRIGEIFALRRTAANLLSTYVGRDCGERILSGRIKRGDIETIRAIIWFSDLRGFTDMSSRSTPREVIDVINRVFECQVPAIEAKGGEVLKFIGDGMLAIFPLADGEDPRTKADAAIGAAEDAQRAVDALPPHAGGATRIGLALHLGELAYGNIGGVDRLDFTAIGPAVNLAARLESVSAKVGRPIVVSEELANVTSRATEQVGEVELKGIPGMVRVFAPR